MTRVLVVDDEPQIRRALRVVLRANGYNVTEAATGEAALDAAATEPFDVMILDLVLPDVEGIEVPCAASDGDRRSWFVYVVQVPARIERDAMIEGLRQRGIDSKPYLPAIHLMTFYRERFGWRPGQFPVCEDVSRRSLALPFFPDISEAQIEQVARALRLLVER